MSDHEVTDAAGKVLESFQMENGKLHGLSVVYGPAGEILQEASYVEGLLTGDIISYDGGGKDDGRVVRRASFLGGKLHGPVEEYDEEGRLKQEIHFHAGARDGVSRTFDNESLRSAQTYWNDLPHGPHYIYDDAGVLASEMPYVMGKEHGTQIMYSPLGEKVREVEWALGVQHGKSISYHPNGEKSEEAEYVGGMRHGEACSYYDNGALMKKTTYIAGVQKGASTEYDPDGREVTQPAEPINVKIGKALNKLLGG